MLFGLHIYKYHAQDMRPCNKTIAMASKNFITWVVLFILTFLFASKAASREVPGTSRRGMSSKSALILGFYFQFVSKIKADKIILIQVEKKRKFGVLIPPPLPGPFIPC